MNALHSFQHACNRFLGRLFDRVDLPNKSSLKCLSVRVYVRTYVRTFAYVCMYVCTSIHKNEYSTEQV